MRKFAPLLLCSLLLTNCADDKPYLDGFIKRASDAIITSCDPYNRGDDHTCVVYASAYAGKLFVFDATLEEMVLSDMGYLPLSVKVGGGVSELSHVHSSAPKFPYFFALDSGAPGLYVVRAFPDAASKERSFSKPHFYALPEMANKITAFDDGNTVYVVLTHSLDGAVSLVSFDRNSGEKKAFKKFKLGITPNQIALTPDRKKAIIADQTDRNIFILELSNSASIINKNEAPISVSVDIGMSSDQLVVAKRDFGNGLKNYALALNTTNRQLKIVSLDEKKVIATHTLQSYPMAMYLPDTDEISCCKDQQQWFAVASLNGSLSYLTIKNGSIKEQESIDLLSKHNMALSIVHVKKIIGGSIKQDASLKQKVQCSKNRKMFFIASYGMDKRNPVTEESFEVEAQGTACEGASSVARLGYKSE